MTVPSFNVTQLDGNLGRTLDTSKVLAMAGISSAGAETTPQMMTRVESVIAEYGYGPLVDYASFAIKQYGIPVLCSRVPETAAGEASAVTSIKTGTSTVTINGTEEPNNDYEGYWICVTGGTIGIAGITFKWSLDGGRTLSAETALGTANTFSFPDAGTLGLSFGTGTLVAGDYFTFQTVSATWGASDLTDSVEALGNHSAQWEGLSIVGALTTEDFAAVELVKTAMVNRGRDIHWTGGYRLRTPGEPEATYLAAAIAEFGTNSTYSGICYDGCRVSSATDGRRYKRSPNILYAPMVLTQSEEMDVALTTLGALPATITDENGNPEDHDESITPGADDAGFVTLRTWPGDTGVYFNNPRIYSSPGSDYEFMQHRRVVNLALRAVRLFFRRRLSKAIRVNKRTGYILETEAREIEKGATAILTKYLLAKPKASAVACTVSRVDAILTTKTLTANIAITPLGYPKTIELSIGLFNPALVTL